MIPLIYDWYVKIKATITSIASCCSQALTMGKITRLLSGIGAVTGIQLTIYLLYRIIRTKYFSRLLKALYGIQSSSFVGVCDVNKSIVVVLDTRPSLWPSIWKCSRVDAG